MSEHDHQIETAVANGTTQYRASGPIAVRKWGEDVRMAGFQLFLRGFAMEEIAERLGHNAEDPEQSTGPGPGTLYAWARSDGWREARAQVLRRARNRVVNREVDRLAKQRERDLRVIDASMAAFVRQLAAGQIRMDRTSDLLNIIRARAIILSDPEELIRLLQGAGGEDDSERSPFEVFMGEMANDARALLGLPTQANQHTGREADAIDAIAEEIAREEAGLADSGDYDFGAPDDDADTDGGGGADPAQGSQLPPPPPPGW